MLRKAFVALTVVLFVAYCFGVMKYQYRVAVPDYVVAEVDLLKGRAAKKWDDKNFQTTHLANLAAHRYQTGPEGLKLPDGTQLPPDTVLERGHYNAIISDARANLRPARAVLADPVRIMGLQGKGYFFRNPIRAKGVEGEYLFRGGEPIDQKAVDVLLKAGFAGELVGVEGSPSPVSVEMGTMLAVFVIFLGLVAALKGTLVDPLLRIVEERKREIDAGAEQIKKNAKDLDQFQKDRIQRFTQLAKARFAKLQEGRHGALREGEAILRRAKEEERRLRYDSIQKLQHAIEEARAEAMAESKELGRLAVKQVLGREV